MQFYKVRYEKFGTQTLVCNPTDIHFQVIVPYQCKNVNSQCLLIKFCTHNSISVPMCINHTIYKESFPVIEKLSCSVNSKHFCTHTLISILTYIIPFIPSSKNFILYWQLMSIGKNFAWTLQLGKILHAHYNVHSNLNHTIVISTK